MASLADFADDVAVGVISPAVAGVASPADSASDVASEWFHRWQPDLAGVVAVGRASSAVAGVAPPAVAGSPGRCWGGVPGRC